jgi:predicted Zn-dependent protease with MMP-like domain
LVAATLLGGCVAGVDSETVRTDTLAFLGDRYGRDFIVRELKWDCHEGNRCPDDFYLVCAPRETPELTFPVWVSYETPNRSFRLVRESYHLGRLSYEAGLVLGREMDALHPASLARATVLGLDEVPEEAREATWEDLAARFRRRLDVHLKVVLFLAESGGEPDGEAIVRALVERFAPQAGSLAVRMTFYRLPLSEEIRSRAAESPVFHQLESWLAKTYFSRKATTWDLRLAEEDLEDLGRTLGSLRDSVRRRDLHQSS